MKLFAALPVSQSGVEMSQTWLDTVAGNIANANDTVPTNQPVYQPQSVQVAPVGSGPGPGVNVVAVLAGSSAGTLAYQPTNPLANRNGMVRVADVGLSQQLTTMVMAQNSYQANVAALNHAVQAYQSALTLGS